MFIDRLLNDGSAPLLEQTVRFAAARHELLANDIANIDTPGFKQKDMSLAKFQKMLAARAQQRDDSAPGLVRFDDIGMAAENKSGMLYHDIATRSPEILMSDFAKNALMHNLAIELLRKQFSQLDMALKEKAG